MIPLDACLHKGPLSDCEHIGFCEDCIANKSTTREPGKLLLVPKNWKQSEQPKLKYQVGGNHYTGFAIQPVEFITKNHLTFLQGCVIKRICRYNKEGGKGLEDLNKIKHELDLIIQMEGLNESN